MFRRIALWDGFGEQTLETFRFEDDIKRKVFSRIPTKYSSRTAQMNFYERLFLLNEVKPSPDHKTEVQIFDNLFPHAILDKHVEERRRLPRFPAKTDACSRAHTSCMRKISFS